MGVFRIRLSSLLGFLECVLRVLETPISGRTLVGAPSIRRLVEINIDWVFVGVVFRTRIGVFVFERLFLVEMEACYGRKSRRNPGALILAMIGSWFRQSGGRIRHYVAGLRTSLHGSWSGVDTYLSRESLNQFLQLFRLKYTVHLVHFNRSVCFCITSQPVYRSSLNSGYSRRNSFATSFSGCNVSTNMLFTIIFSWVSNNTLYKDSPWYFTFSTPLKISTK